jgi:outer membrane receptor for ferric coprogen and ferric-rhodotorulic acid
MHHSHSLVCRNPKLTTLSALLAAALCLLAPALFGQSTEGAKSTPSDTDDVVMLSPFSVSVEKDYGYQATTTLAGGRIQTELKDTPATVSILTKEFMQDLGLDNVVDFSTWAPNAEVAYAEGGFLDEYRTQTRGLSPSFGSRNYFRSYSGGDAYNTERLEFARGPNALLFGDASHGGITTTWTKQARLDQRIAALETRFDSLGSYRGAVDVNAHHASKKVGVRLNAVYAQQESWRDVEERLTRAIHLATTVALAKNTQFRLEGEYADRVASVPFSRNLDQASGFFALTPAQQETAKWTGPRTTGIPAGTARQTTSRLVVNNAQPDVVLDWINRGRSTGTGLSIIPDGRGEIAGFPSIVSREFNPNAPAATLDYETTTLSAYLDQRIGEDLFVQVAYNYALPKNVRNEIRWDDMWVDVNEFLPGTDPTQNGPRNPYYGQIFGEEEARRANIQNELHEYRMMAAWKFKNSWMSQAFSALVGQRKDDYQVQRFRQVPRGIRTGTTYFSSNSTADVIYHRRYWSDLGGDYVMPSTFTKANGEVLPIEWRSYEDTRQDTVLTSFQLSNVGKYLDGRLSVITGYRYDKYDRIDSQLVTRAPNTSPDAGRPEVVEMDPDSRVVDTETSPSIGGVFWLTKGLGVSANYAESFNLTTQGNPDIYGRAMGPANAKGTELGLRFDMFDSRLTGSVLYYENTQEGGAVTLDSTNVINRINKIWDAIDTSRRINPARDTQSNAGDGYEAEIVYNPTRAWRMRFTYGRPNAEVTDRQPMLKGYIEANRATWTAGGNTPATGGVAGENTVQATLDALDLYLLNNAADGMRSTGGYKWNASYFTSYRFSSGKLKGFTLGAGARYTSERFIGRTSIVGAGGINEYTEWWSDDLFLMNAMARYEFKVNKLPASVQLNVSNLLDNDQLDYRGILTVGSTTYRHGFAWVEPRKLVGTFSVRF